MNEKQIEQLLRQAPEPRAPAGLLQTLQREITLPRAQSGRVNHFESRPWLRRWLPAWLRRLALAPLARAWPKADWLPRPLRAKTLLTNLSLDAASPEDVQALVDRRDTVTSPFYSGS